MSRIEPVIELAPAARDQDAAAAKGVATLTEASPCPEKSAAKPKKKTPGRGDSKTREFLPAALEILETPANPIGRAIALTMALFFLIAIVWSLVGGIDIVAVAQGRVMPVGGVKLIQPLETGTVRAIHVRDGQHVEQGDLLIELDPTDTEADLDQLNHERMESAVEAARLVAVLDRLTGDTMVFQPPDDADPEVVELQQNQLWSDVRAFEAELANFDAGMAQREAERAALVAELAKLHETIPLIAEREAGLRELVDQGLTARPVWLEVRTTLIEARHDIQILSHRIDEAAAAIESMESERAKFTSETQRQFLAELLEVRGREEEAELALRKADKRDRLQDLVAPVAGIVQQLAVHTVGGVVTPAEVLMIIVPDNAPLEVQVLVLNKDKGFVHAGQEAVVKLEAFPFTKYGTIDGEVLHLSGDAIEDEQVGLAYDARVSMADSVIRANGEDVQLVPGMTATVEIKTGERKIIEFLLSPMMRYQDEALRER